MTKEECRIYLAFFNIANYHNSSVVGFEPICVGVAPALAAIMPHIPSYGGEDEEKAEFEGAHESLLIKTVTSVRRNTVTFLRVFRW